MSSFETFKHDVLNGLNATPRSLPSKYFYDDNGSRIFQQIMALPEYYLTRCELEIFETTCPRIINAFESNAEGFDLIEFGAGDGLKTSVLIRHLLDQYVGFRYLPVDISAESNQRLFLKLKSNFPDLDIETIDTDYFSALEHPELQSSRPKVILFLGSNVGNFNMDGSIQFFSEVSRRIKRGDKILVGMDLKKDPSIVLPAYNDSKGVTRAFNLNLLHRINRELGGQFNVDDFEHLPVYDPENGTASSYLKSLKNQEVCIQALDQSFAFEKDEVIHTEISQKYDEEMIEMMASGSGFEVLEHFFDARHYFTDSLWQKK